MEKKFSNLNYYNQLIFIFESEKDNSTVSNCFERENAFKQIRERDESTQYF